MVVQGAIRFRSQRPALKPATPRPAVADVFPRLVVEMSERSRVEARLSFI